MTQSAATKAHPERARDSVKDTVESILVAFILAFIFRAFVVEAFVIPTGSMAPTLLGAHMHFDCDRCGYVWDVNVGSREEENELIIPSEVFRVFDVYCPNCAYRIPRQSGASSSEPRTRVWYGDRILVLKYMYLLAEPRRWDVVVFKSPAQPQVHDYTQNYIKRLVGTPGEAVMILDGDIYVAESNEQDLTKFRIQRRPEHVQDALWRTVFDMDFMPRPEMVNDQAPFTMPWQPRDGEGFEVGSPTRRTITFNNLSSGGAIFFNHTANRATSPLTDWLGYNVEFATSRVWVGDLKLRAVYERRQGDGPLRLKLSRYDQTFIAEILPGSARLLRSVAGGVEELLQGPVDIPASPKLELEFTNVDYRVSLKANGRELLATTEAQYAPDVAQLLEQYRAHLAGKATPPRVEIQAEKQVAEISRLGLWRDIYYLNEGAGRGLMGGSDYLWASPHNVIRLNKRGVNGAAEDEYFVLGDNSQISGDARGWTDSEAIRLPSENLSLESGRVPGRFLLGRAFFVYWPAGFQGVPGFNVALIPNFGSMRFIH